MSYIDAIISEISEIEESDFKPTQIWLLNPKDLKRIYINKLSILLFKRIKLNKRLRRKKK